MVNIKTNAGTQRLCAWCGVGFMALFLIGMLIAGFFPPSPAPGQSAHVMAQFFREHHLRIRIGLVLCMFASALLAPWAVSISVQLSRIEGRRFTPMAWTQMICGGLFVLEFIIPYMILMSAAFRPQRSDQSIQLLIDTGWIMFASVVSTLILQGLTICIAVLRDPRERPIMPRWVGYFCAWACVLVSAGFLVGFVKTGPFTWQGLLVWWLPVPVFGAFMVGTTVFVLQAIKRQVEEPEEDDDYATAAEVAVLRRELDRLREGAVA